MAWYSNIYKAFIIGSVISFTISLFSQSHITAYNSSIAGYSILILAILTILTILILKVLEVNNNVLNIMDILLKTGPFLLMLSVIGLMLYLIIYYKSSIIDNHVSQNYNTFSVIVILLILLQLYIIYNSISTSEFENKGTITGTTSGLLYLIGVITLWSAGIVYTILKYFTTDGFSNIHSFNKPPQFNYLL
jgi:hypothetical protein